MGGFEVDEAGEEAPYCGGALPVSEPIREAILP